MSQIVQALLGTLAAILGQFLPVSNGFPPQIYNGLQFFIATANGFGFIIPWSTMWNILIFLFWFEIGLFAFKFIMVIIGLAGRFAQAIGAAAQGSVSFIGSLASFIAGFFV